MAAVLGKVNAVQLICTAFVEVPLQVVNEWIGLHFFCDIDAGESMYVHMFDKCNLHRFHRDRTFRSGAYFGLAVAFVLYRRNELDSFEEKSRYTSDIFSMVGTLFLFCFWPSFNAGMTSGIDRMHAITNTYVSICASVIGAFLMSTIVRRGKLDMVHVQNSILAGGVAVGTVSTSNIGLHGAMMIGTLAGMVSVLGFHFLLPKLKRLRIHDTCGVHNQHGMPGVTAGIARIVVASIGDRFGYSHHLTDSCLSGGIQRTDSTECVYQAAALGMIIGLGLVGWVGDWYLFTTANLCSRVK